MSGQWTMRIHHGRDQYDLRGINPSKYNYSKLVKDVDDLVLENLPHEGSLFFNMMADIDGSMEQIEICGDSSLKQVFQNNKKYKEIMLHLMTDDVVPMAVDMSCRKDRKKERGCYV